MTLMIMPILLFMSMMIVPFFVYTMKLSHVNMVANHALKEAEAVGYVSPAIMTSTNLKLEQLGMGEIINKGNPYPSYTGSTDYKVLRDASDPIITLSLKYPAPHLFGMLPAIGGPKSSGEDSGYYHILLYGKSEAYE
ncbi:MAG: hypothetical protein H7X86_02015 [Gorillibacterium sp.]|nr:hypothetical protein [Gorillibacterium sp.]